MVGEYNFTGYVLKFNLICMTFRPSDDVLDEISMNQQQTLSWDKNSDLNQDDWKVTFNNSDDSTNSNNENYESWINQVDFDFPTEEVKAPDLSELLKESDNNNIGNENLLDNFGNVTDVQSEINKQNQDGVAESSGVQPINEVNDDNLVNSDTIIDDETNQPTENVLEYSQNQDDIISVPQDTVDSDDKISDAKRSTIVSWIEWSINSNLDFLVDDNWLSIIEKYKKLNRFFFKWWLYVFSVVIWVFLWVFLQVKANDSSNFGIISDTSIENIGKWFVTSDKVLSPLTDSGVEVNVMVPYGSSLNDWVSFQSKSNLISYKWIILPQLASIDYNSWNFVSLEDFNDKKLTRQDIQDLIDSLIINDSIYRKTTNLPNIANNRWVGKTFQWLLVDGFNLWCINNDKLSDFVCDKFLDIFYKYGKYYDLSEYASEIVQLQVNLQNKWRDTRPICDMVNEYVLHAGKTTDQLVYLMNNCGYKKVASFVELENSLQQPLLSNKVFDDPDLNAYKLLSAQQSVYYKNLEGTSFDENYVKSYLNFVQSLIEKDKGSNHYLQPIYKDLLYVFNTDELYQKLVQKWNLYSDLKLQIDKINNWNSFWLPSLLSQLTTPDIVQNGSNITWDTVNEKTVEDLFSQYYSMTDRLKIRKVEKLSEEKIKVQTEVFSDKILSVTNGETLKLTVVLRKQDNLLYVDSVKITNQPKLSDILEMPLSDWNVTFYSMLNNIDDEVENRYESTPENIEEQLTFCEKIMEREDIVVYTCDDSSISLYKWENEYNFVLVDWVLDSFTISDEDLQQIIQKKLDWILFMKDSTPSIITSILDYTIESEDESIEKKLEIIDQFRIHFKLVPDDIHNVEWKSDVFLVDFTIGDFKLQAYYDINTRTLTKISYTSCSKPLEIRQLSLEITSENEPQLIEILNNPRLFFATVNPSVYKKYQKVCWW